MSHRHVSNINLVCLDTWNYKDYKYGQYKVGELLWLVWKYYTALSIAKQNSNNKKNYCQKENVILFIF